jgi:hypothetical protein
MPLKARATLSQKHEVVRLFSKKGQRVVAVGDRVHVVAALLEKEAMWPKKLDLIVDPEDSFRGAGDGHGAKTRAGPECGPCGGVRLPSIDSTELPPRGPLPGSAIQWNKTFRFKDS